MGCWAPPPIFAALCVRFSPHGSFPRKGGRFSWVFVRGWAYSALASQSTAVSSWRSGEPICGILEQFGAAEYDGSSMLVGWACCRFAEWLRPPCSRSLGRVFFSSWRRGGGLAPGGGCYWRECVGAGATVESRWPGGFFPMRSE